MGWHQDRRVELTLAAAVEAMDAQAIATFGELGHRDLLHLSIAPRLSLAHFPAP